MAKWLREGLWSQSTLETESTTPCVTLGKFFTLSGPVSLSAQGERNSSLIELLGGIH